MLRQKWSLRLDCGYLCKLRFLWTQLKKTKLKRRFVSSSDSRRSVVSILHIFLVKDCIVWPPIEQFSWNLLTLTRDELYEEQHELFIFSFRRCFAIVWIWRTKDTFNCKNERRTRVKYHNRYYTSNILCIFIHRIYIVYIFVPLNFAKMHKSPQFSYYDVPLTLRNFNSLDSNDFDLEIYCRGSWVTYTLSEEWNGRGSKVKLG